MARNKHKYFQGPGGVYYDYKQDRIFLLEPTGTRIYNFKKNKVVGPMFEVRAHGVHHKEVAVIGMKHTILLGDL